MLFSARCVALVAGHLHVSIVCDMGQNTLYLSDFKLLRLCGGFITRHLTELSPSSRD